MLSSNHNVTLYDLTGPKAKILRSFALDNEPRTIALSPGAEVLGAAYDGGIEVYSLHPNAGPTDRRAVNCDTVDSLAFSPDGVILLGTTLNPKSPTTVIVSAQHFSTDMPVEGLAQLWTTQVLFPRSSRDSSHASLLPGEEDEEGATWTFTYDRTYDTFRAVRVDDLRNGHTYFAGPSDENLGVATPPSTLPASTKDGSLVAAGFGGERVWVYGIPGKLDLPADYSGDSCGSVASTPERSNSNASKNGARERGQIRSIVVPQWQLLCDKIRNVFIRGREIGQVSGLSGVKFVMSEDGHERLVVVAGGGVDDTLGECGEEEFFAIGGGRVTIYDFARGPRVGSKTVVSTEIGDGIQGPVETLEEEHRALEVEVDIARRRTVALRRNAASRQSTFPIGPGELSNIVVGEHTLSTTRRYATAPSTATETAASRLRPVSPVSGGEDQDDSVDVFDDPYVQGAPRSRTALSRAATAARSVPRTADSSRYARAVGPDGQPPIPNRPRPGPQGGAERWEPPPPPYTPRNNNPTPLPAQLLWSLQGPPRHPEVHLPAPPVEPPGADTPTTLDRTRSTIGSVMRRGSIFRLTTNNIGASRSAPVSPAVGAVPNTGFHNTSFLNGSQQFLAVPVGHELSVRRSSTSDASAALATVIPPVPQIPVEHYAPQSHNPPPRSSSPPRSRQHLTAPVMAPPTRRPSPRRNQSIRRVALRESYAPPGQPQQQQQQQLSPPPIPSTPRAVSPRNSVIMRRNGNLVMRRPSRAGRSAHINVREAKRKQKEQKAAKDEGGGRSCIIM